MGVCRPAAAVRIQGMTLRTLFWATTVACIAAFSYSLVLELVSPEFDWLPNKRDRSAKYVFAGCVTFTIAVFIGMAPAVYRRVLSPRPSPAAIEFQLREP